LLNKIKIKKFIGTLHCILPCLIYLCGVNKNLLKNEY